MSPLRASLALLVTLSLPAFAQQKKGELPERTEADILKTVTLPEGYEATVFARPPQGGGYPISVSAAIDGTIFVAIDENGSLGRDRNPATGVEGPKDGRIPGKVVRMRDTDGDGKADEFKTFCEVESPRGVIWDAPSGTAPGTLYVMHPPNLTAYTDTDGDGKADKQEDILTGLGFDLGFRGADHTTNGCRLAIDGFIYIAMGDYGCIGAKGKDGRTLTHRGGGVVRIRPDGTGLELVTEGTRNIYDVAVSPTLDIFVRDNTNDGGGWNDRVSFLPPGAHMGYPFLFKNFTEDMLDAMADFGGGSPCGSLWLDEPGLPKGLFTVEWGAGGIFYHDDLTPNGAGWKLTSAASDDPAPTWKRPATPQKKWLGLTRPTDMDVDASGRLYITSWEGATFNYNGPFAGYVLRVVKKDVAKVEVPDLGKATPLQLAELIASDSAVMRQVANREFARRAQSGGDVGTGPAADRAFQEALTKPFLMASQSALSPAVYAAQLLTLFEVMRISKARWDDIAPLSQDASKAEIRLIARGSVLGGTPLLASDVVTGALRHASPRVRAAAITALCRLHQADAAPSILPLVADADPIIAHLAFRALRELKATQVCLGALDSSDEKVKPGALRALYGIYDPAVVDGLLSRLPGAKGELRRGILNALCRLANQDAPYESPSVWWSTRPDTSGPVYQPIAWSETDKISAALKTGLDASNEDDAKWLVQRMYACKVAFPGLVELMLAKAGSDTPAKLTAIEGMIRNDNSMPPEAIAALQSVTGDDKQAPDLRARALRIFQKCAENGSVFPGAMTAFAPLAGHDLGDAKLTSAFEDFSRDGKNGKWVGDYAKALAGDDAPKRQLAAIVLVNLSTGRVGKEQDREAAKKAVDKGFAKPESAAALLTAIARTGAKPLAEQVKANLNNPNNTVAEAALFAFQKLGLSDTAAKQIGTMKYEEVFAAVQKGGDAKAGQEMFLRAGCIACHTIGADEPPKGPVLSAVAKIYDRATLTESILKPSAKIAQGFESTFFKTKKGEQIEGFVTREGGDSVDVRNIAGQTVTIEKGDVTERGTRPQSMMPEGLLNAFTPAELSNLLAWLESLKK
jgi:putative heme-binding domain-containing protein